MRNKDRSLPGHMIRVPERTWQSLRRARLKAEQYIIDNPHVWPNAEDRSLSMAEFIDMMISLLPSEYRNE